MIVYSLYEILFYLLLYAFLGWVTEVAYYSVVNRILSTVVLSAFRCIFPAEYLLPSLFRCFPFWEIITCFSLSRRRWWSPWCRA